MRFPRLCPPRSVQNGAPLASNASQMPAAAAAAAAAAGSIAFRNVPHSYLWNVSSRTFCTRVFAFRQSRSSDGGVINDLYLLVRFACAAKAIWASRSARHRRGSGRRHPPVPEHRTRWPASMRSYTSSRSLWVDACLCQEQLLWTSCAASRERLQAICNQTLVGFL